MIGMHLTVSSLPQQQTAGTGITNINGQLNAQFGGMSFTAGFGFFPSLFGLQFQVRVRSFLLLAMSADPTLTGMIF
jgi:hypothetical protein